MHEQSIGELASIAINSADGGNMDLLGKALDGLRKKSPSRELFRAICSIMVIFGKKNINGSFMKTAEQIFNDCATEG
ncbi:MAG: hypothetical protein PHQ42_01950 [Patescibacteria group bacterium]|nr:hypothetical protein [Patescibacteria group bacterium]